MALPEGALLTPRDPALLSSDHWPSFALKEVKVVSQVTGEPASLLSTYEGNHVRVTGQLTEIGRSYRGSIRDHNYLNKHVALENVFRYAFAEYDDGSHGFWAAGEAGWFELEGASSSWQPIFDRMSEAASLLYMMADGLRRVVKPKRKLNDQEQDRYITSLFRNYLASRKGNNCFNDIDDVRKSADEHRHFIITSMIEGQENLDWVDTPMMRYYESKFPDDMVTIRSRYMKPSSMPNTEANSMGTTAEMNHESSPSIEPRSRRRKGRPRKYASTHTSKTFVEGISEERDHSNENYGYCKGSMRKRKSILRPSGTTSAKKMSQPTKRTQVSFAAKQGSTCDDETSMAISCAGSPWLITVQDGAHLDAISNSLLDPFQGNPLPSSKYLPRRYLKLSMTEYNIPSLESHDVGRPWECNFDGCEARVHQASRVSGLDKVRDHLRTHISDSQDKIDLALSESRPYLPVHNLVRRLQAFASAPAQSKELAIDSIERRFASPITRRY